MARMTIAQLREKEVHRLASYKNEKLTEEDLNEARKIQNSYYRLCGLSERVCERQNDERYCDSYSTHKMEEKEERWIKRLGEELKPYGLKLIYPGIYPVIYTESGSHAIGTYFYD